MNKTIEFACRLIKEQCDSVEKDSGCLSYDETKEAQFSDCFERHYDYIIKNFMRETSALDAHKQAAIITISCLESNIIKDLFDDVNSGNFSIFPQLIAVSAGLSYMNDQLNELLKRRKINQTIDEYTFPVAIVCNTPYMEIICRLLYYEQNDPNMQFNILELSDRYFLIEYITLLQNGIEPSLLKD